MWKPIVCVLLLIGLPIGCGPDVELEEVEPLRPQSPTHELQPAAVKLTWVDAANASKYYVYRGTGPQRNNPYATVSQPTFVDHDVVDATEYQYRIAAANDKYGGLVSEFSDPISVTFYAPGLALVNAPQDTLDFGVERFALEFGLRNRGAGTINWHIPDEIPWIQFTPSSGSATQQAETITATVDRTVEPGQYRSTVVIQANVGEPISLTLLMEVSSLPKCVVEPEQVTLCAGDATEITVANAGRGAMEWELLIGVDWLSAVPQSGTLGSGEAALVQLRADSVPGTLAEPVVEVPLGGDCIGESLIVTVQPGTPQAEVRPNTLTLSTSNNWRTTLTLDNTGECGFAWEADADSYWLSVEPGSGHLDGGMSRILQISANPEGLDAGEHQGEIHFPSLDLLIPVRLTVLGTLSGRATNVFTGNPIAGIQISSDVGNAVTDSDGRFDIRYHQEGVYAWRMEHPDYLSAKGTVQTQRAGGDVSDISLIPVPRSAGDISSNFGFDTPWNVAFTDDERLAFVTNRDGDFVSVVDIPTNRVAENIEVGRMPLGVAYAGGEVFVANNWGNSVSVLDAFQRKVIATIEIPGLPAYLTAHAGKLYVTLQDNISGNQVAVVDIATRRVERRIPVGPFPHGLAVDPLGSVIYVAAFDGDSLSIVDLGSGTEQVLPVGPNPQGVAISPTGEFIYVACAGRVSQVDSLQQVVTKELTEVGARFACLAVISLPDEKGDLVYATDSTGDKLWVWHPASGESASVNTNIAPFGLVSAQDGSKLYGCITEGNKVQSFENR